MMDSEWPIPGTTPRQGERVFHAARRGNHPCQAQASARASGRIAAPQFSRTASRPQLRGATLALRALGHVSVVGETSGDQPDGI